MTDLCNAYYKDVINCLLEATDHLHEEIRCKAVGLGKEVDAYFEGLSTMLEIVYSYGNEVEWEEGEYDYVVAFFLFHCRRTRRA